jgi:short-subunit dehydrogenase
VVNNAGIMKNQRFLHTDPALIEAMIKTNVHPYVFMTKYALKHFQDVAISHQHKNALLYSSSTASMIDFPMFSTYCGTKTHNVALANMVRMALYKSATFKDMVTVQSLHPATVTTNLNNFRSGKKAPDAVSPDECARGSLSDLNSL